MFGGIRLTVVGCSGSYPGPDSPASCYLVEAEGPAPGGGTRIWRILLDLGNGALGVLHRFVDPLQIDAVFLSHLHADHCIDMCSFHVLRRYHPSGAQPQIPVWGPQGSADRMARAYDLPTEPGMKTEFEFKVYPRGEFEFGPFTLEAFEVKHPVPAYALRVRVGDAVLAYTGDCGPCAGVDEVARGAHLLLAEAAFCEGVDNPPDLHLTGREAGELAVRGRVDRLVLTHVPPWHDAQRAYDEAKDVWSGPLELAATGSVYQI